MLPRDLKQELFAGYPLEARRVIEARLPVLRDLPVSLVPLLLRELIAYDWKFPAERRQLDHQLGYLEALSPGQRRDAVASFAKLEVSQELERMDWVNQPAAFSEKLSAHLWATHQIEAFRAAAVAFFDRAEAAAPQAALPVPRLGLVVAGKGVQEGSGRPLFRKLLPQGTLFRNVRANDGLAVVMEALRRRASSYPAPFAHWYIDGGTPLDAGSGVAAVSYAGLTAARAALQERMKAAYESTMGPEAFRSMLARLRPVDLGMSAKEDGPMSRFEVSLLTEGSGTQVYSTVFVQWAAREALRRAEPLTLLARFTPRQRERGMGELLEETHSRVQLDPEGSLVDAGMGAYYTWLNLRKLAGADGSRFFVWFEDRGEALAIGPRIAKGVESVEPIELSKLLGSIG